VTSEKKGPGDSSLITHHSSLLLVGIVRKPHGLKGEVSVEIATDFPQRFAPGERLTWKREEELRELAIVSARFHGGRLLVAFEGVGDVDAARALAGGDLLVAEEKAFAAPAGFYFSHEIEGYRGEDPRGRLLGVVQGLSQTAAGPMLTLEVGGKKEALVPFVEEMVLKIDRQGRRIVLDLPEGLLDL
jgi:16S rRNA processing protein RimM